MHADLPVVPLCQRQHTDARLVADVLANRPTHHLRRLSKVTPKTTLVTNANTPHNHRLVPPIPRPLRSLLARSVHPTPSIPPLQYKPFFSIFRYAVSAERCYAVRYELSSNQPVVGAYCIRPSLNNGLLCTELRHSFAERTSFTLSSTQPSAFLRLHTLPKGEMP